MRPSRLSHLSLLALLLGSSCGGDGIVGSSSVTGTYTLRSVNGSSLPYTFPSNPAGVETVIVDDALTLYQGGTYSELGHTRLTSGGQTTTVVNTETGAYGLLGTSITLTSSSSTRQRVALGEANTLKIIENSSTYIFSK